MNNNISVLIADDNEDLAKELSSYIGAKPNMTVTAIATDGEEAYTLISQTRPDVIILDLVMPKLDGIGVLKRMQTLTFDKKPKIIVYSVSSIAIKMAASVSPLIDYCLLKPQSNERVYEVIQDLTSVPMVSAIPLSHNITAQKAEETDLETIVTDFIHELGVPYGAAPLFCMSPVRFLCDPVTGLRVHEGKIGTDRRFRGMDVGGMVPVLNLGSRKFVLSVSGRR